MARTSKLTKAIDTLQAQIGKVEALIADSALGVVRGARHQVEAANRAVAKSVRPKRAAPKATAKRSAARVKTGAAQATAKARTKASSAAKKVTGKAKTTARTTTAKAKTAAKKAGR